MISKQIIKKFSDNHCLVLENNQISLRENEFTAYRIVLGKSTNELLEFVKDTYLQLQAKEQECEELKKQLIQKDEVNTFFNTLDWNSAPCEICPKKNCLDEIEGIVNFISNITNCDKAYYCKDKLDEILQKISECEGNNEN